jgi:hypothetical protein
MHGDYQCAVCEKSGDGVSDLKDVKMHAHGIAVTGSRSVA